MHLQSTGVPQSDAKVPIWFQKAADQGYMYAQAELGYPTKTGGAYLRTMYRHTCGSTWRRHTQQATISTLKRTETE